MPKAFGWLGGYPLAGFQTGLKQKNPAVCAGFDIRGGGVESYSTDIPNFIGGGC